MKRTMKKITAFLLAVALCFPLTSPVNAASSLSKKEKSKYCSILWNQAYTSDANIYDYAECLLYDVNNDGRKELIVWGHEGWGNGASYSHTVVYSYDRSPFVTLGALVGVSSTGIKVDSSSIHVGNSYESFTGIYTFDKKFNSTVSLTNFSVCDSEGEISDDIYSQNNKEISKSEYNELAKEYTFKEVGKDVKSFSASSKETILKKFGVTSSKAPSNGTYTCTHNGSEFYFSENSDTPQIYKASIKKSKDKKSYQLVLYGNYANKKTGKLSALGTYTFTLSSKCKVVSTFADGSTYKLTKKYFNNQFNNTTNNDKSFSFTVKNGKVTKITL